MRKKVRENEIHMIFSCSKYDNIRRKVISDINEVDNIKFQIGNKLKKPKLFFAEGSFKARIIFGQFLIKAFESR